MDYFAQVTCCLAHPAGTAAHARKAGEWITVPQTHIAGIFRNEALDFSFLAIEKCAKDHDFLAAIDVSGKLKSSEVLDFIGML